MCRGGSAVVGPQLWNDKLFICFTYWVIFYQLSAGMPFIVPRPGSTSRGSKFRHGLVVQAVPVPEKLLVPMTPGHVGRAGAWHEVHGWQAPQVQVLIYCAGLAPNLGTETPRFGNLLTRTALFKLRFDAARLDQSETSWQTGKWLGLLSSQLKTSLPGLAGPATTTTNYPRNILHKFCVEILCPARAEFCALALRNK